ncbi:MAG: PEP-CTERM sorting domain-containing protein [Verrucomicrobiota bacterium JB023]|nr:PEP-CTERM sorting domain-containing protein [Verrucomicrobiota bacterium JB023]
MKTFATLTALALTVTSSQAVIVWSGLVDISIPAATGPGSGLDGVYVDILSGFSTTAADDNFATTDVNFFLGGAAILSDDDFLPVRSGTEADSPVVHLLPGTRVGVTSTFGPVSTGVSDSHLGSLDGQFESGEEGYLGFAFSDNGGEQMFGWMRVTLTNNGTGTIHEWAYETVSKDSIIVGAIPEPSAALLSLLGLTALLRRKRA